MSGLAWALIASAVLSTAALARAEPTASALVSVQPNDAKCVGERALRVRMKHWLKRPPEAGVTVVVHATAPEAIWFSVEREGRMIAERRFESMPSSCSERLDALALAIALAVEGAAEGPSGAARGEATTAADASVRATEATAESEQPGAAKPAATPEPPPVAAADKKPVVADEKPATAEPVTPAKAIARAPRDEPTPPEPSSPRRASGGWRLAAGGGYLLGALPNGTLILSAGVEPILARNFELRFAAVLAPSSQTNLAGGDAQTQVFGGRALACAVWPLGSVDLEGCGGAIGGAARATGEHFMGSASSATLAWLGGLVQVGARFPANSVISFRLALDAIGNLVRPRLQVDGPAAAVATGKPFAGAGSIELLFALP